MIMTLWKLLFTGALILLCGCSTPTTTAAPTVALPSPTPAEAAVHSAGPLVFVGTYTSGLGKQERSEGIFVYRMDTATGALTQVGKAGGPPNPSYLAVDPSKRYLV